MQQHIELLVQQHIEKTGIVFFNIAQNDEIGSCRIMSSITSMTVSFHFCFPHLIKGSG